MIRRSPLISGLLSLALLFVVYALIKDPIYNTLDNQWYDLVSRASVTSRSALLMDSTHRYFGMYRPELPWDYSRYYSLSEELRARPRIVSWYQAWSDQPEGAFKREAFQAAHQANLVPLVTWEPWISDFKEFRGKNPDSSLQFVIRGDLDAYIHRWARASVREGHPLLLRPMHEPGNAWYAWSTEHGNTPKMVQDAWRHIVGIFRQEGAENVAFVWTPYSLADTACYPGDEYVDWIGLDVFNYGNMDGTGVWTDMQTLVKNLRDPLRRYHKPFLLAEVGTTTGGGNATDWWKEGFRDLSSPELADIRGIVLFDNPVGITPVGLPVDWRIPSDTASIAAYREHVERLSF